jgi:putative ABC transport system permease protein
MTTGLIVAQLALTLVLLAGAGLMLRSFMVMYRMDIGIDTSRLVVSGMIIPATKYPGWEDRTRFLQSIDDQFVTAPAIEAASTASAPPFAGGAVRRLEVDGRQPSPGERLPEVTMLSVGSRYFDTIGVRLVQGRAFTNEDGGPGRRLAIVNQRLVEQHLGGQNPIGRTIRLSVDVTGAEPPEWLTVVGVVPNVRQRNNNQEREPDPIAYIPHRQNTGMARSAQVIARMRTDPRQAAPLLRQTMMKVDPDQAINTPRTLDEMLAQQRWFLRVFTTMFTAFGLTALVLAAVGLYAVTAYSVTQHTRDIGTRMVLGAKPSQVIWLFLRRSLVQLTIGLTIGLGAALAAGQVLQSMLVQTSARDPLTLAAIVVVLIAVSLAACIGPARRATRLDPLEALRQG